MRRLGIALAAVLAAVVGLGSWQVTALHSELAHVRSEQAQETSALLTVLRAAKQLELSTRAAAATTDCLLTAVGAGPGADIAVTGCQPLPTND